MNRPRPTLVLLEDCEDDAQAQALRRLLEAQGLFAVVQARARGEPSGPPGPRVLVPAEDLERARALLRGDRPPPGQHEAPSRPGRRWLRAVALVLLVGPVLGLALALALRPPPPETPATPAPVPPNPEEAWAQLVEDGDKAFEAQRFTEAEVAYVKALGEAEKVLERTDPRWGDTWMRLGGALKLQGRLARAEPVLRQALAAHEEALGERHPLVADDLVVLSAVLQELGRLDEAEAGLRRAVALHERDASQRNRLAQVVGLLGMLHEQQGALEEAVLALDYAATLTQALHGEEHEDTAVARARLAEVWMGLSRPEDARALYERALPVLERVRGEDDTDVVSLRFALAMAHMWLDSPQRAQLLFERVLASEERLLGAEHPELVENLLRLALAHQAQGQPLQAAPLLERAVRICDLHPDSPYSGMDELLSSYAQVLQALGRPAEAATVEARLRALPEE